jgi:hypothetical protein
MNAAGGAARRVNIPVRRRPFDRSSVTAYRDSLLGGGTSAAGGSASAERIRLVFGNRFPVPANAFAPAFERMTVVGPNVWIREAAAETGPSSTWYVVEPVVGRVVARIETPREWRVLGGDARRVIVLVRDPDGVEAVRVYNVVGAPRD